MIASIPTKPFSDQRPGTSGLRKKVRVFSQPHYVENFIQSTFDVIDAVANATLVIGGDGRYYNRIAIKTCISMAIANGASRIIVGRGGILSTPAASHIIRTQNAVGGFILSASHNPGGPEEDFGIKFNVANGGPAPEKITDAIFERSLGIEAYRIFSMPDFDLDTEGRHQIGPTVVDIIDPVTAYANLMETLFDFSAMRELFAQGFRFVFDAMHAVTGPYATEIFVNRLGAPKDSVIHEIPLEDFGGHHPDPNLVHAADLYSLLMRENGPDLGAASDGDGDRNLIIGKGLFITPSDSLAVICANARLVPGYARGLAGIARSMPTSQAADKVAQAMGVRMFETPTGWKFFGNLLDAGYVTMCGEESAGTGSDHVREKDGLWAVLMWLNILAVRKESVKDIMTGHWKRFGRNYYARYDYENVSAEPAATLMALLEKQLPALGGTGFGPHIIASADNFQYLDPTDNTVTANQGLRLIFQDGSRVVVRLSGTGTQGATIRIYIERFEPPEGKLDYARDEALHQLFEGIKHLSQIERLTGRQRPDVIT